MSLSHTLPSAFEVLLTIGNYLAQRSSLYLLLFSLLNGEWLLCFLLFNFFLKLISVKLTFFLLCHPWYVILCIDVWDLGSRAPLKFLSTFRVTALISRCRRVPSPLPSTTTKLLVLNLCSHRKGLCFLFLACCFTFRAHLLNDWINRYQCRQMWEADIVRAIRITLSWSCGLNFFSLSVFLSRLLSAVASLVVEYRL